jgi:hypothetical protein
VGFVTRLLARIRNRSQHTSAPDWDAAVRSRGFIPVMQDWVGAWALTNDHQPVFLPDDDPLAVEPIVDARERNVAFKRASERYPELTNLKPVRKSGDYDCPSCGGTGRIQLPPGVAEVSNIMCQCGGLGWLPAGYVDPHHEPSV